MTDPAATVVTSLRHLDAMLAEHLFGWVWRRSTTGLAYIDSPPIPGMEDEDEVLATAPPEEEWYNQGRISWDAMLPAYTRYPGAEIWLVVERMQELGYWLQLGTPRNPARPYSWSQTATRSTAWFTRWGMDIGDDGEGCGWFGGSPAIAIALAALAALGHPVRLEVGES